MFGYSIFIRLFSNLCEEKKKMILGNIFKIKNVSVYSIVVREHKIIFRMYSDRVFYQFIFILEYTDCEKCYVIHKESRFFCCFIYPYIYHDFDINYPYSSFVKILLSDNEEEIYHIIRTFL